MQTQTQIVMILEPAEWEMLQGMLKLASDLKELVKELKRERRKDENEWMKGAEFRGAYKVSNATFWRYVKAGKIESLPDMVNEKEKRYRWSEGEKCGISGGTSCA